VLFFLALTHVALLAHAHARLDAWLRRPRVWLIVAAAGSRATEIYLWHLLGQALVLLASWQIAPQLLTSNAGQLEWWATRPVWFTVQALLTVVLVGVAVQVRPATTEPPRPARVWAGSAAIVAGFALVVTGGLTYLPGTALVLVGVLLARLVHVPSRSARRYAARAAAAPESAQPTDAPDRRRAAGQVDASVSPATSSASACRVSERGISTRHL
jgi:hypothetical protein